MVAEDEDEASKTEEPSERKITKAKEEGDIAISQEAKSFIMLLGMLAVVWLLFPYLGKWYISLTYKFIETPEQIPMDLQHIRIIFYNLAIGILKILALPFLLFMILGICNILVPIPCAIKPPNPFSRKLATAKPTI